MRYDQSVIWRAYSGIEALDKTTTSVWVSRYTLAYNYRITFRTALSIHNFVYCWCAHSMNPCIGGSRVADVPRP
jgi:hypothetical protein